MEFWYEVSMNTKKNKAYNMVHDLPMRLYNQSATIEEAIFIIA